MKSKPSVVFYEKKDHNIKIFQNERKRIMGSLVIKTLVGETTWGIFESVEAIEEWVTTRLFFNEISREGIIVKICNIRFMGLQQLGLTENCIQSLEGLSRLNAPKLKKIYLRANHIHQISPLKKTHFLNIQWIWLDHNPINEIDSLSETLWPSIEILEIALTNEIMMASNIHPVFKFQNNGKVPLEVLIGAVCRISESRLDGMWRKKIPNLNMQRQYIR